MLYLVFVFPRQEAVFSGASELMSARMCPTDINVCTRAGVSELVSSRLVFPKYKRVRGVNRCQHVCQNGCQFVLCSPHINRTRAGVSELMSVCLTFPRYKRVRGQQQVSAGVSELMSVCLMFPRYQRVRGQQQVSAGVSEPPWQLRVLVSGWIQNIRRQGLLFKSVTFTHFDLF